MWQDAWTELDRLAADDTTASEVQLLRLQILTGWEKWHGAAILAESLADQGYWDTTVYLMGSHAIRRARSLEAAEKFLRRGESHLQHDAHYHCLIACYACRRGDLKRARSALYRAISIEPELRALSLQDEDLEQLRLE